MKDLLLLEPIPGILSAESLRNVITCPKLISTLALLCLLNIAMLPPEGALHAAPISPQRTQFQNIEPTQTPRQNQRIDPGIAPAGLSSNDWVSIQTQIAAGEYRPYKHANDGFVSSNPAHGWRIHYSADGTTTLRPRDRHVQAYHLGLKLSAVGFTEPQALDRPKYVTADDFAVTYQWNDYLREW